jgi:hypothetical protein
MTQENYKVIGYHAGSWFNGLVILEGERDTGETLKSGYDISSEDSQIILHVRETKIFYTMTGRPYICRYKRRYYLEDIMRT